MVRLAPDWVPAGAGYDAGAIACAGWRTGQVWLEKVMRLVEQPGPGILNRVRA